MVEQTFVLVVHHWVQNSLYLVVCHFNCAFDETFPNQSFKYPIITLVQQLKHCMFREVAWLWFLWFLSFQLWLILLHCCLRWFFCYFLRSGFFIFNVIRVLNSNWQKLFITIPVNNAFVNTDITLTGFIPNLGVNCFELVNQSI